jgi:YHS domain-containing protein
MKKFLFILLSSLSLAMSAEYPLTTCVVSGEKLDGMGKPYVFQYQGTEVRLCCEDCRAKFDKDPAKYLAKIAGASKSGE